MIFVIWKNHDGVVVDKFLDYERTKTEDLISELAQREIEKNYGTEILKIIDGEEVSYEVVKRVEKVKIIPKEE